MSNCVFCHGVPGVDRGGNIRTSATRPPPCIGNLEPVRLPRPDHGRGMPDFTGKLTPEQLDKIKAFIQGTADAIRPK